MSSSTDALHTPASISKPEARRRPAADSARPAANGEVSAAVHELVIVKGDGERPKETEDSRRAQATPAAVYQRKRRHGPRPETPKWQTALSVVTKLCFLLLGLMWLGQMILKLSNGNAAGHPFAAVESDDRISEVESLVKKTAKMLQVQLDVVDKRIGTQIGAASKELTKKIEEKSAIWGEELRKVEARTEGLGKSLGELKETGLLTKDEFESFKDELSKRKGARGGIEDASLEEIRALAKEIVEKEIEKHAADGLGRVDYALASAGAEVITHSQYFVSAKTVKWFPVGKDGVHSTAKRMLEPSFGEPGQCFALQGSSGYVHIKLRTAIVPEAVTLEHVSKSVAYDRSSAPKDCVVSAWLEKSGERGDARVLTKFSYDLEKSNAQTFDVESTSNSVINTVRFEFTTNHGNPSHTCIYRFRVHGHEPMTPQAEEPKSLPESVTAGLCAIC